MRADERPLPPFRVFAQFFQAALVDLLLDHAISNRSRFQPSTISNASEFNPSKRISHRLSDLGALGPEIEGQLRSMAPSLMSDLHVTPFEPVRYEIEMVVHGDGAFLHYARRHGHRPRRSYRHASNGQWRLLFQRGAKALFRRRSTSLLVWPIRLEFQVR